MSKNLSLKEWCIKNGHKGITKECVLSAFNSKDEKIHNLAKREKLKGVSNG